MGESIRPIFACVGPHGFHSGLRTIAPGRGLRTRLRQVKIACQNSVVWVDPYFFSGAGAAGAGVPGAGGVGAGRPGEDGFSFVVALTLRASTGNGVRSAVSTNNAAAVQKVLPVMQC